MRTFLVIDRRTLLGAAGTALAASLVGCGDGESPRGTAQETSPTPAPPEPGPAGQGSEEAGVLVRYGSDPDQYGLLHLPAGTATTLPVVVVLHGGIWVQEYDCGQTQGISADLATAGFAALNLEYRRVGGTGGWPATFEDVAAGVDAIAGAVQDAAEGRLDPARVGVVGHSAGGHLAAWAALRERLPAGAPGADPVVRPRVAVSQSGLLDLVGATQSGGMASFAVRRLMLGGPEEHPERYAAGSPTELLPSPVPIVCVHGTADDLVSIEQSRRFVDASEGTAELVPLERVGHFEHIDPRHPAWTVSREAVTRPLG